MGYSERHTYGLLAQSDYPSTLRTRRHSESQDNIIAAFIRYLATLDLVRDPHTTRPPPTLASKVISTGWSAGVNEEGQMV